MEEKVVPEPVSNDLNGYPVFTKNLKRKNHEIIGCHAFSLACDLLKIWDKYPGDEVLSAIFDRAREIFKNELEYRKNG